jgi:hypothetical protein
MDEYCREKGFAGWFETSAKDNINIDDAAKFLVGTVSMFFIWDCVFLFKLHYFLINRFSKMINGAPA